MLDQNYIDGNYIDEALAFNFIVDGQALDWRYLLHDHLYSPVALMSEAGAIRQRYEYDAYGRRSALTEAFAPSTLDYGHDIAFTGRQLDILDGTLHHMHYRHRDYSPKLGRFMQHDPLGINPEAGLKNPNPFFPLFLNQIHFLPKEQYIDGLNVVNYVRGNPVNNVDPSGTLTRSQCLILCGAGGTACTAICSLITSGWALIPCAIGCGAAFTGCAILCDRLDDEDDDDDPCGDGGGMPLPPPLPPAPPDYI